MNLGIVNFHHLLDPIRPKVGKKSQMLGEGK